MSSQRSLMRSPHTGQIVCISLEIVMVGAIMCSRLQPQPHYARGTVQHPSVGVPAPQCRGAGTLVCSAIMLYMTQRKLYEGSKKYITIDV